MALANLSLSAFSTCSLLILVLPLWFLFLAQVDAVKANRREEVGALVSFREECSPGSYAYPLYVQTWNETDETPCGWFGVTCTANYTVAELDFSGWGMSCVYMEPFVSLGDLRHLDLSYNKLTVFPDALRNLTQVVRLDVSFNPIDSEATVDFSACKNLQFLSVEGIGLTILPFGLSDLVNLLFLSLASNNFTGPFPFEELGGLSSLLRLDLSGNSFYGSIPSLPNSTNLVELTLDGNSFTRFEVPWLLGAKSLFYLSVSNNQLEGTIPSEITSLLDLAVLNMADNKLSGKIPSGFSKLNARGKITTLLDLSQNQLSGEIPTDLLEQTGEGRGAVCAFVNVSHNRLTGFAPINGSGIICFDVIDLSHNSLRGPIPSNLFDIEVRSLLLQNNSLSGDVVDVILNANYFIPVEVRLQDNLLTRDLSRMASLGVPGNLGSLGILDLSNNHLQWSVSDAIPDPVKTTLLALTSVTSLLELRVGGNNFSGASFPTTCFYNSTHNQNVEVLNNNNTLQLSNSTNYLLQVLDLSNSQLQGEILGAAFNNMCLPNIQLLNLSNNRASGPLLESIIVQDQQNFIVDVSNNNLSGTLPTISPSSNLYNPKYFSGNDGLCGPPLSSCPEENPQQQRIGARTGVPWWELLVIVGGSVTVALGSCLAATWRWRVYLEKHKQDADLIKTLLESREPVTLMPLSELKKATSNFAHGAQIGEGGFGIVYTGELNDGTIVAIKRSKHEGSHKNKEQFLNEVRVLSLVNHRHLVKLLGCCMENRTAVLVFEFVSNGTLKEHLHGKFGIGHLSWKQRLNIAIQTADGLNYLHCGATSPVFHRDVKSTNILLNEDLHAKVADFGISKLVPLQATHVSTIAVQGTIGYIDPEYYTAFQLTEKSDVYSFGVVLLELISAKLAVDIHRGGDETSLVIFASPYIESGDLEHLIDPVLIETYSDQSGHGRESILSVGRLAMKCLKMTSKARPSMKEVLTKLQNCWLEFVGTSKHLDSISEDDDDNFQGDSIAPLPKNFFQDGSSLSIQNDDGIEMPHFFASQRFRL